MNLLKLKKSHCCITLIFSFLCAAAQAQLNFNDKFLKVQEEIAYSSSHATILDFMKQKDYELTYQEISEESDGDAYLFTGSFKQTVVVFYKKNKSLLSVKSNLLELNVVFAENELENQKFTIISNENFNEKGEKWVETTWGKPGYPYKFKFEKTKGELTWVYFIPLNSAAATAPSTVTPVNSVAGRPPASRLSQSQIIAIEAKIFAPGSNPYGKPTATKTELTAYLNTLAESSIGKNLYASAPTFKMYECWFGLDGTTAKFCIKQSISSSFDLSTLVYYFDIKNIVGMEYLTDKELLTPKLRLYLKPNTCEEFYTNPVSFKGTKTMKRNDFIYTFAPGLADNTKVENAFLMLRDLAQKSE